ncbi:HPr(Ser) kinase/phosphatase [Kaarinaea lacus]
MTHEITAATLFETHKNKLLLDWLAGSAGGGRLISEDDKNHPRVSLIGHLNAIHPNQVQILGPWEIEYLQGLGKNTHHDVIQQLFQNKPAAVIVTDGMPPDPSIIEQADKTETPLFASEVPSQKLINLLQYYLEHSLAEIKILHGVFMEVYGLGVLLRGEPGIGKSELALELINRGHRLIADDAPEFFRVAPDTIRGRCPEGLQDFLEVRGLGIINIREMFGDSAIKPSKNLRFIVNLYFMRDELMQKLDRLQGSKNSFVLLDVEIPEVQVPVAPGRNLAVLVEAATRQHIQLLSGYDAAEDFIQKQQRLIAEEK